MSSTKDEIAPRRIRERLNEEASLQRAPITREPWPVASVVRYRRGSLRNMTKLAVILTRELVTIVVNIRAIS
ncbi:Hypothetical predicted protein [Olea europaea subsp. europaea]|uniref:Uncharacterized protein n=1 Tax=Olea europaea subsp. europaea TaxID=158383 RepID=A0A8S0QU47_OLEEU|nr:Hypothetical predicted protein [Olea europaea subsp. europaea]